MRILRHSGRFGKKIQNKIINKSKKLEEKIMAVSVRIPTPLRKFTDSKDEVAAEGNTVAEVVDNLESNFPGIKEKLCDESGKLRKFLNHLLQYC